MQKNLSFTIESALEKVRKAENLWNTKDPIAISKAYTEDCWWRNRNQFINGRDSIEKFLSQKWQKELDYKLIKELWAFIDNRISVKFQYEYHDNNENWFRAYGNENWEFADSGLMRRREASINDVKILESERQFTWAGGPRPLNFPGLKELELLRYPEASSFAVKEK